MVEVIISYSIGKSATIIVPLLVEEVASYSIGKRVAIMALLVELFTYREEC